MVIINKIADLQENVQDSNPYNILKTAILIRTKRSTQTMLHELLNNIEIGNNPVSLPSVHEVVFRTKHQIILGYF